MGNGLRNGDGQGDFCGMASVIVNVTVSVTYGIACTMVNVRVTFGEWLVL